MISLNPPMIMTKYLQVSRDVGSRQDAGGRGEENGEHREEVMLHALLLVVVGEEVFFQRLI